MEWQVILALMLAVPIIVLPVAFIWFLDIGGIYGAVKAALKKRASREVTEIGGH